MRRKALVVLGMHRSGTSALTRTLNLAGSFLPANVLPPVPGDNDRGFWEPERLVEADKRALETAGLAWDSANRLDPAWFGGAQAESVVSELAQVFEEDFSGHDLFVIKDPRLCRIVPPLRSALERCGVDAAFVLILRHPAAVAASLLARNRMPAGYAQRLWLRYLLDAERCTRDATRIVIGFDELMTDWKATLARVSRALDVTFAGGPGIDDRIASFLDPALVHHADRADAPLSGLAGAAWDALRQLQAQPGSAPARDTLDRVAQALDEAEAILAATPASLAVESKAEEAMNAAPPPLAPPPSPASLARHSALNGLLRRWIASGHFMSGYYRANNPDAAGNPAWHYLWRGRKEGRSPHPLFDPRHYARAAGIEHLPRGRWFSHFVSEGESRGISPHPLVDLQRLAKGYEVEGTASGLFARFAADPEPPCNPHPLFDVRYYLGRYPDVAELKVNPLVHYLLHGAAEERQPSAYFDEQYYRSQLKEPVPPGTAPLQHYVETGGPSGISPSLRFDPGSYALRHPDDVRHGSDPLAACLDRYHGKVPEEFAVRDGGPRRTSVPAANAPRATVTASGYRLRRRMAADLFGAPGFWTSLVPRIGFAVTRASDTATAGDYFTALELALELERRMPCKAVFLEMNMRSGYDAGGLDVLIVMRDDFELDQLQNRPPRLVTIGWARNWIDRWAARPWAQDYNAIWASSAKAADTLSQRLARPVEVMPIATSAGFLDGGAASEALRSDYCFTGSHWNPEREISQWLDPGALPYQFAVYGYGWENHPVFSRYARGGLPYSRMKDVYASTRIVVDDANSVTKQWGSVNSRVFDALAAGALVVTNGVEGARATFGDLLPTFASAAELHALLARYLGDEPARRALVEQLHRKVADQHTYAHRARQAESAFKRLATQQLRFAIKIGTPNQAVREEWGDFHFATGLRRALTRLGHSTRIDCLDDWHRPDAAGDDVVIVLRGLSPYQPRPDQVSVMWNISHPDKVSDEEYERYDHVFVASASHAKALAARLRVPVTALLQCTDPELFHPDAPRQESHQVLFVGNSRRVFRRVVKDALAAGLPLSVFGTRWENLIPARHLKGAHIANSELAGYYASAGVVLNDHWDGMRECGLISNRLFDAAACGARIVTDRIPGLDEVFGGLVETYDNASELSSVVSRLLQEPTADREKRLALARQVMRDHSFDARAQSILAVVQEQDGRRTGGFPGE